MDRDRKSKKRRLHAAERTSIQTPHTTHPPTKDLIDGGALFQSALCHYFGSHLLHIQHESVQRFLDVGLFVLFFLGRNGRLPAEAGNIREVLSGRRSERRQQGKACQTIGRFLLRVHGGADVSAGLLLDRRGDDGRVRDAGLVEAVRRWGHHVRRETAGDQADGAQIGGETVYKWLFFFLTAGRR